MFHYFNAKEVYVSTEIDLYCIECVISFNSKK